MHVHVAGAWRDPDSVRGIDAKSSGVSVTNALNFINAWNEGQLYFEFHTSGSTGPPKPIRFSREMMEASARLSIQALGLKPGMNALVSLDTRFVAGGMMLVRGLVGGLPLILCEPSSNPLKQVEETVDFLAVVPLQLKALLEESPQALDRVAIVIIGGAPLDEEVISKLASKQSQFFATYGMTETLTHIALRKLNGPDRQQFFYPLPGVRTSLDDRGCLVIQASHLGPGSIVTNDLAMLLPDGGFRIDGRVDDVINSGGHKVNTSAVESVVGQVLRSLDIQARFFVAGVPDSLLHQKVCLVIESTPLPEEKEENIFSSLEEKLARFDVPREILYRARFAETPTQKIDKRASLNG